MKVTTVSAYESKTRQAEIFKRAAAGETIIVTKNGAPLVEIRPATTSDANIADAVLELAALQKMQLAAGAGGGPRHHLADKFRIYGQELASIC